MPVPRLPAWQGETSGRPSAPSANAGAAPHRRAWKVPGPVLRLELPSLRSPLLAIKRFHLSDRVRQIGPRLVVAIEGRNLVIAGTRHLVLGGDDLDVVGHTGLEA